MKQDTEVAVVDIEDRLGKKMLRFKGEIAADLEDKLLMHEKRMNTIQETIQNLNKRIDTMMTGQQVESKINQAKQQVYKKSYQDIDNELIKPVVSRLDNRVDRVINQNHAEVQLVNKNLEESLQKESSKIKDLIQKEIGNTRQYIIHKVDGVYPKIDEVSQKILQQTIKIDNAIHSINQSSQKNKQAIMSIFKRLKQKTELQFEKNKEKMDQIMKKGEVSSQKLNQKIKQLKLQLQTQKETIKQIQEQQETTKKELEKLATPDMEMLKLAVSSIEQAKIIAAEQKKQQQPLIQSPPPVQKAQQTPPVLIQLVDQTSQPALQQSVTQNQITLDTPKPNIQPVQFLPFKQQPAFSQSFSPQTTVQFTAPISHSVQTTIVNYSAPPVSFDAVYQELSKQSQSIKSEFSQSLKDQYDQIMNEISQILKPIKNETFRSKQLVSKTIVDLKDKLQWLPLSLNQLQGMNPTEARLFTIEARMRSEENLRIQIQRDLSVIFSTLNLGQQASVFNQPETARVATSPQRSRRSQFQSEKKKKEESDGWKIGLHTERNDLSVIERLEFQRTNVPKLPVVVKRND